MLTPCALKSLEITNLPHERSKNLILNILQDRYLVIFIFPWRNQLFVLLLYPRETLVGEKIHELIFIIGLNNLM